MRLLALGTFSCRGRPSATGAHGDIVRPDMFRRDCIQQPAEGAALLAQRPVQIRTWSVCVIPKNDAFCTQPSNPRDSPAERPVVIGDCRQSGIFRLAGTDHRIVIWLGLALWACCWHGRARRYCIDCTALRLEQRNTPHGSAQNTNSQQSITLIPEATPSVSTLLTKASSTRSTKHHIDITHLHPHHPHHASACSASCAIPLHAPPAAPRPVPTRDGRYRRQVRVGRG
jgi:hypothetical protein